MSERSALEIARAAYRDVPLYDFVRPPCAIDLSDNTNRFGAPPAARRVLAEAAEATVTRYPTLYSADLKAALARYAGVRPEEIVTGCGSDDVLDSAIRAFAEPGETLAYSDPTFPMVPIFARMNGLTPIAVPFRDDGDLDAAALAATGARIVYVCSPNNPTGTTASRAAVERLLEAAPGLVIVDEAYAEFAGTGWIGEAPARARLLVTRTLSKAFGLAGLRIGYGAGSAAVVMEVEKSRGPFKVGGLSERAAVAALDEDQAWVRAQLDTVVANRARFIDALRQLGLAPLPSVANFVLVPVPGAARVATAMRSNGVAVRPFANLPRVGDAIRITIGPWEMMTAALERLAEALR